MGPVEALRLALSKEMESIKMYEEFSRDFPAARDIFLFLMEEEGKHKHLIEKKIHEITKY